MSSISSMGYPSFCPPSPLSHQPTQTGAKPPRALMKRKFAEISAERKDPVEVAFSKFKSLSTITAPPLNLKNEFQNMAWMSAKKFMAAMRC